jgi:hypothetical protein
MPVFINCCWFDKEKDLGNFISFAVPGWGEGGSPLAQIWSSLKIVLIFMSITVAGSRQDFLDCTVRRKILFRL